MKPAVRQHQHFIDNRAQPASGGGAIDVVDPSSGLGLGSLARGTAADIDRAVPLVAEVVQRLRKLSSMA